MNRVKNMLAWVLLAAVMGVLAGPAQAQERNAAQGVSLEVPLLWFQRPNETRDNKPRSGTPLVIELSRQSILIAAREELGLRTMDPSLGEPAEAPGITELELSLDVLLREGSQIELGFNGETILEHQVGVDYWNRPGIINSVRQHEAISREQVSAALREAGFDGEPNAWHDSAAVPEDIQALADELNLVSQFRAARALHALIRSEGESPQRLWTLARVYANLGQESRWFIRAQFAVFQARSLLYAQRLAAKAPAHPLGNLSLAYAWTMATYTRTGASHLDQFDNKDHPDKDQWLAWARLLRACCAYDTPTLDELIADEGPTAPVAALWSVIATEFTGLDGLTFGAIARAMDANPLSSRPLYSGYDAMGVSMGHWLTEAAPSHFQAVIGMQFARIEGAPQPVQEVLATVHPDQHALRDIAQAAWALQDLAAEGQDPHEMSYGVLGTLIDEANALHILYRAKFMRHQWGVDTEQYLRATVPALSRHPYQPLIVSFILPRLTENRSMRQLMSQFEPGYMNMLCMSPFNSQLPGDYQFANGMTQYDWWDRVTEAGCMSGSDWLYYMRWYTGDNISQRGRVAGNMGAYDPHHPMRIALRVKYANLPEERVGELATQYGHHAIVADALADLMEQQGDLQAALAYAEVASTGAPEMMTIRRQARLELLMGDEERWLALMESILELPDYGLDHAKVNQIIAHTYMNRGRFEDALPYSQASAQSWAAWAMDTYVMNLELLGQHNAAYAFAANIEERYGAGYFSRANLLIWSDRANPEQLIEVFTAYHRRQAGNDPDEYTYQVLYNCMELGLYERCLEIVNDRREDRGINTRELLFGVLAAQHLGQEQDRDEILQQLSRLPRERGQRLRFSQLADLLIDAQAGGEIDWDDVAQWADEHDTDHGHETPMNVGIFALGIEAERERGLEILLALARTPDYSDSYVLMARAILRANGYTNEQMTPTGFNGHQWSDDAP